MPQRIAITGGPITLGARPPSTVASPASAETNTIPGTSARRADDGRPRHRERREPDVGCGADLYLRVTNGRHWLSPFDIQCRSG